MEQIKTCTQDRQKDFEKCIFSLIDKLNQKTQFDAILAKTKGRESTLYGI